MNSLPLLRLLLAAIVPAALPSCVGVPGEYGGYGGGYSDGPGYSSYQSSPGYYGGGSYYGGGYDRSYYGTPYYGGSRYYRDNDHDHDHDNHRSSGSSRNSSSSSRSNNRNSDNDIRLVKVRDGTRGDVPEGYHSKDWYQQRGISLSKNTYETREGDRRGYTGGSSGSKSKSGSNSNSGSGSKSKSSSNSKTKGKRD